MTVAVGLLTVREREEWCIRYPIEELFGVTGAWLRARRRRRINYAEETVLLHLQCRPGPPPSSPLTRPTLLVLLAAARVRPDFKSNGYAARAFHAYKRPDYAGGDGRTVIEKYRTLRKHEIAGGRIIYSFIFLESPPPPGQSHRRRVFSVYFIRPRPPFAPA